MAQAKKGLGRGLSALIPTDDMDFLAEVARGDFSVLAPPSRRAAGSPPATGRPSGRVGGAGAAGSATASGETTPEANGESKTQGQAAAPPEPAQEGDFGEGEGDFEATPQSLTDGATQSRAAKMGEESPAAVRWVPAAEIEANPYQPRRTFDEAELRNLTDSIREHGVLQPLIVRPIGQAWGFGLDAEQSERRYQLIAGERRWRASQAAGLERVPVIVRDLSDQQSLELAIIENVQRHDISALDAALAFKRLGQEFGLSQERIAARVGKSRSSVANTLRLLELPPEAQQALQDGLLSEGHGRAILLAPRQARTSVLRAALRDKHSVRDAEEFARRVARQAQRDANLGDDLEVRTDEVPGPVAPQSSAPNRARLDAPEPEDVELEQRLQRALSCRVQIKRRRAGGQIVLFAVDDDQFERLTATLSHPNP